MAEALAEPFVAEVETVTVADPQPLTAAAVTLEGETVGALIHHILDHPGSIVCMSSHGRSGLGRRLIGSTAESLLRTSPVPLVVVGPHVALEHCVVPSTVVAGLAWPPGPDRLVALLAAWIPILHATVDLVHVGTTSAAELYVGRTTGRRSPNQPDLDNYATRLRDGNIAVNVHRVTDHDPARALLKVAGRTTPPTMLAVDTHRGDAVDRHHDVAYQLIRHGPHPVLATTGTREPDGQ